MKQSADVRLMGGQVLKKCPIIKESKFRYLVEYYENYVDYHGQPAGRPFLVQKWHWKRRVTVYESQ